MQILMKVMIEKTIFNFSNLFDILLIKNQIEIFGFEKILIKYTSWNVM